MIELFYRRYFQVSYPSQYTYFDWVFWSVFTDVELTLSRHWLRQWLVTIEQVTRHSLEQLWQNSTEHIRIYANTKAHSNVWTLIVWCTWIWGERQTIYFNCLQYVVWYVTFLSIPEQLHVLNDFIIKFKNYFILSITWLQCTYMPTSVIFYKSFFRIPPSYQHRNSHYKDMRPLENRYSRTISRMFAGVNPWYFDKIIVSKAWFIFPYHRSWRNPYAVLIHGIPSNSLIIRRGLLL